MNRLADSVESINYRRPPGEPWLVCPRTSPLIIDLLTKTRAEALEFLPQLLSLSLQELQSTTRYFAQLAHDGSRWIQLRSPESWAGEFLHHTCITDPSEYFGRTSKSTYAEEGKIGAVLVDVAAAYAWKLRKTDPDYTVPESLRHNMKLWDEETRQACLRNTAGFMAHSYDLDGVPLSRERLAENLNESFPSSVRWEN